MQNSSYRPRTLEDELIADLGSFPAVALVGPRQAGKSTLAQHIVAQTGGEAIYLDLEYPPDRQKLADPALFFESHPGRLVCLDEIQRVPDLFPVLRSVIDRRGGNGQFLVLGSASPQLLRQSSETLAGRIVYSELTPFTLRETTGSGDSASMRRRWTRGGFPRSFLAASDEKSLRWRRSFIATFLERDIPQLGIGYPAETLRRLWTMLAHLHGQLLNASRLGGSLGVSHTTVRRYLELLQGTFMIRLLQPCLPNVGKRLTKSPKLYLRDSGVLQALLSIENYDELLGHPVFGASWEGLAIENITSVLPAWNPGFYRTSDGTEVDLILEKGRRRLAFEMKATLAPKLNRGVRNALADLAPDKSWVVYPGTDRYPLADNIAAIGLRQLLAELAEQYR